MRKLIFIILVFITSCVVNHELLVKEDKTVGQPTVSEEITTLVSPTNRMIVVENGRSTFRDIHEVMDENDALFNSDTVSTIATKEDIGAISVSSYERDNDTSKIVFLDGSELKLRDAEVTFNTVSDIAGTFPNGTLIQTRGFSTPGDGAGALYQVQSSAPVTPDDTIVTDLGGNYAVLQPQNGQYDVRWFGAVGDNVTNNGGILNKAASFIAGNAILFIPRGRFLFDQTILISTNGLKIRGIGASNSTTGDLAYGSVLKYIGTGSAISATTGINSGQDRSNRINLESFALIGTDSCEHGIKLDLINITGGSLQSDRLFNLRIHGFTNVGSYGVYLTRAYDFSIDNCRIWSSENGIYLGDEAVNTTITNSWIRASLHGIHSVYGGYSSFDNGLIGYDLTPSVNQRGIYNSGQFNVSGTHFEGNRVHIEATPTAVMTIRENKFNAVDSTVALLPNGASVRFIGNLIPDNTNIQAGTGTEWVGNLEGGFIAPTITADLPSGFATYNYLDGSAGAWTLQDYSVPDIPEGEFTLEFLDDSVTIDYEPSGGGGRILLQGNLPFKGHTGDKITFKKRNNTGGTATIVETSRTRRSNIIRVQSKDYNVHLGESGLIFNNNLAADTVNFYLPVGTLLQGDYPVYTFIKEANFPVRIFSNSGGTRKIQGATNVGDWIELTNTASSVTLVLDSLTWKIVSSSGFYKHQTPASNFYTGGVLSGVGLNAVRDSVGLTILSQDLLLWGNNSVNPGTSTNLSYNSTAGSNTRRITMHNDNTARIQIGTGIENPANSNRPNVTGIGDQTFSASAPAMSLIGFRHGGTFASKTDMTDGTAQLLSLLAYGYRLSAPRLAASIVMNGGTAQGSNYLSGLIGFNTTTTGGTFARRMTLQRTGDLYLGTGLASADLEATTSKLLIRGDGTTTGYGILFEDSGGTDKFTIQDNGNMFLAGHQVMDTIAADPTATANQSKLWTKDIIAGQAELFARGETGSAEQLTGLKRHVTSTATSVSTTYAAVSDLTFNVEAGKVYMIEAYLFSSSLPVGGIKVTVDGSATITSLIIAEGHSTTYVSSLGSDIYINDGSTGNTPPIFMSGTVVINAAGTLGVQFAQQDADGGTTNLDAGSWFRLTPTTN